MNKTIKFTVLTAIAVICCVGGIHLKSSGNEDKPSGLTLMNIEALSSDKEQGGRACYSSGRYNSSKPEVLKCGTPCHYEPTELDWFPSTSTCR